jgi:HlyD family secretion protein
MKRLVYLATALLLLVITVAQVKAMRRAPQPAAQKPSVAAAKRIVAEGRFVAYPGSEITVGSDVAGTIERLAVDEKDVVKKGDVIAIVRADDTRAALGEAQSRVGEADADIRLFESEVARATSLWEQEVGSKQAVDRAGRDLEAARARRASAVAEVRRLEALVEKTVITAPIDGTVIARLAHPGETIAAGDELITIANLTRTRVEAEVDEFDAARVKLGAVVAVRAEGFDEEWSGRIEEIPDAVISRRLKPQDPSKPIDTRVLLVKIAFDRPAPLKLGQRVEVQIGGK